MRAKAERLLGAGQVTCSAGADEGEGGQAREGRALAVAKEVDEHDGRGGAYLQDLVQAHAVELQAASAMRHATWEPSAKRAQRA